MPPNDNVVAAEYPQPDIDPPASPVDDAKIPHTTLAATESVASKFQVRSALRSARTNRVSCGYCQCHGEYQIPPLVSRRIDDVGTQALSDWIDSLHP